MIPASIPLFFQRCSHGEATAGEYAAALAAVEKAFGMNQRAQSVEARRERWRNSVKNYGVAIAPRFGLAVSGVEASLPAGDR